MKRILFCIVTLTLLNAALPGQTSAGSEGSQSSSASSGSSGAQANTNTSAAGSAQSNTPAATSTQSVRLAEGAMFRTLLSKSVDAKKNKPGDEITAKTADDIKFDGQVVIPKGSRVIGHVTEAQARSKGHEASSLGIAFDRIVMKDGSEVPLSASIQAIAQSETAAQSSVEDEPPMGGPSGGGGMGAGRSGGPSGGMAGGAGRTAGAAAGTVGSAAGGRGKLDGPGGCIEGPAVLPVMRDLE